MSFYEPLDVARYETRLITLEQAPSGSCIICNIERVSLLVPPAYVALSYCWGDESLRKEIVVNGVTTTVTTNLEEALKQLRADGIQRVWADALCINQDDVEEKSHQIILMSQIYSMAQTTYAWLGGPRGERIEAALRLLKEYPSCPYPGPTIKRTARFVIQGSPDDFLSPVTVNPRSNSFYPQNPLASKGVGVLYVEGQDLWENTNYESGAEEAHLLRALDDSTVMLRKKWRDLATIVGRCDYWKRRWIIQEIVVSARVVFFCGSQRWPFEAMQALVTEYCNTQHPPSEQFYMFPPIFRCLNQLIDLRESLYTSRQATLIQTLLRTRHFLSKDDRDKIYAIIGIAVDGTDLIPNPSYQLSCPTVTRDLSREVIRKYGTFDIILMDRRSRSAQAELPTWAPDWLSKSLLSDYHFSARNELGIPSDLCSAALSGSEDTLTVQGVMLGRVIRMTSSFDTTIGDNSSQRDLLYDPSSYYGGATLHVVSAIVQCWKTRDLRPSAQQCNIIQLWHTLTFFYSQLRTYARSLPTSAGTSIIQWVEANANFDLGERSLKNWVAPVWSDWLYYTIDSIYWTNGYLLARVIQFTVHALLCVFGISVMTGMVQYFRYEPRQTWNFWQPVIITVALMLALYVLLVIIMTRTATIILSELSHMAYPSWKLAILDTGMLATVPPDAVPGDKVCFIVGCDTAALLHEYGRNRGKTEHVVVGRSFACVSEADNQRLRAFMGKLEENQLIYSELIQQYRQELWWEEFLLI